MEYQTQTVCILVKAYPQPSQKYEETVCVAAVTEDHDLIRLYPVRFRHLDRGKRFNRFDWISAEMSKPSDDPRPESYRVKEDSIAIVKRGTDSTPEERAKLWLPCVSPSMATLDEDRQATGRSLGIIRPDPASADFSFEPVGKASSEALDELAIVYHVQQSLLDDSLKPLPEPEYVFRYTFSCGGKQHEMQLHDWEVQATYSEYKRRYRSPEKALANMKHYYEQKVPNLHLIMGTMHKRPWQFIAIGVLRTTADLDHADAQATLF